MTSPAQLPDHSRTTAAEIVAGVSAMLAIDLPKMLARGVHGSLEYQFEIHVVRGELLNVKTTHKHGYKRPSIDVQPSKAHVHMTLDKMAAIARAVVREMIALSIERTTLEFELHVQDGRADFVRTTYQKIHKINATNSAA